MRIGVDLDGVVCAHGTAFQEFVGMHFPEIKMDWTKYDFGIPEPLFIEIYQWMIDENLIIQSAGIFPKVVEVLREWHEQGHELFYITRRGGMMTDYHRDLHRMQTRAWMLTRRLPNFRNLHFCQDKGRFCAFHGISILIEDRYEDAWEWNSKDLTVYLLNRPWNQGIYPHRINTLREVNLGEV